MAENNSSKIDQLLDLLLDALQERQAARSHEQPPILTSPAPERLVPEAAEPTPTPLGEANPVSLTTDTPVTNPVLDSAEEDEHPPPYLPEKLPTIYLDQMLGRLSLLLLVLIVLINIPFNRYGTNLARAMPDEKALVIRDGLVLKGEGEEIYVLENNHKRWVSSLEAFEYYGFRWEQVNIVDNEFLEQFPTGPTLSILYKCRTSPHVYAIEDGARRWIKDIPTFEAEGYVWDDVQIVACSTIDRIPSGLPIPPDAGEPPEP